MRYQLSFLDDAGQVRERCISDFETDSTARLWMQVVGAERALHSGWVLMELRCRRRCVARIPANILRRAWKSGWGSFEPDDDRAGSREAF